MGCYKIGSECCNNCVHWDCHTERKFRGNPPTEVYTDSNCDKCDLTGRSTLSKDTCGMFRHLGGVTKTFSAAAKHASNDYVLSMCDSFDESMRAYCQSLIEFSRETSSSISSGRTSDAEDEESDDEVDRAFGKAMEEQGKANRRIVELSRAGLDPSRIIDKSVEFMHLYDKAMSGDGKAQYALAHAFWDGKHGALKEDESLGHGNGWYWCNKSADNGYCWAQLWKGVSWRNDAVRRSSMKDHEKAVKWLELALGHYEVREKDREEGGSFTRSMNSSRLAIGVAYLNGEEVAPDFSKAMEFFDVVSESGDDRGLKYRTAAEELVENLKKNLELLKEVSQENGYGLAMNRLGMIYAGYESYKQYGLILKCDGDKAFQWFSKAADAFCVDAMDNMGNCYKSGIGVEKDMGKAVEWYRKAAVLGSLSGQYHYATCLRKGTGIEKNEKEELLWFMKAGAQGHARSLGMLGWCAENSHGMEEDPELAFEWYRLGAEAGEAEAMYNLGRCYCNGYGCKVERFQGESWKKKAEENGYSGGW